MSGRIGFTAFLILLAAMGAAIWKSQHSAPPPSPVIRTVTAIEETLERTLRITGQMTAGRSVTFVAPQLRGSRRRSISPSDYRLILLEVPAPGSRVRPGDIAARFDPQYMLTRVRDERADVRERELINRRIDSYTEIRRTQLEQRIRVAESELEKARLNVRTIPVRSAIAAERFRIAEEEAQARLRQLMVERKYFDQSERSQLRREELALEEVARDLRLAEANVGRMTYRTPIGGVVIMGQTQRGVDMGEIEAGDEVRPGHAFMQVMDTGSLYLDAIANQTDGGLLRPGARAVIRLDAVPGLEIPGRVRNVGAIAAANRYRPSWVRHFAVKVVPDRADQWAFPNFTGSAEVVTASERGITIPRECVQTRNGRPAVDLALRDEQGNASRQPRPVELGLASNLRIVVRSGIRVGDAVACP